MEFAGDDGSRTLRVPLASIVSRSRLVTSPDVKIVIHNHWDRIRTGTHHQWKICTLAFERDFDCHGSNNDHESIMQSVL